jgi:UDP-N-acetylenolpyruvoylglucosamine reductase
MERKRERKKEREHKKEGSLGSPFCFGNFSIQAEPAGRIIIKVQFTSETKIE